jgi:hypothetical protein
MIDECCELADELGQSFAILFEQGVAKTRLKRLQSGDTPVRKLERDKSSLRNGGGEFPD